MHWVVQDNLYNEDGYVRFLDALERLNQQYDVVKVIPFSHDTIPDVDYDEPVIVMGSDSLVRCARRKGWTPGAFTNDNFDYRKWKENVGEYLLNFDGVVTRFGDVVPPEDDHFFIRPIFDFKIFAGSVITPDNFKSWQEKAVAYGDTLNGDSLVVVSPVRKIYSEYRFFVVNGEVVTGSQYKIGHRVKSSSDVETPIIRFTKDMVNLWGPAEAFVIDIADTPDGLRVIEYNCINSAGFYACDCQQIVSALAELGEKNET